MSHDEPEIPGRIDLGGAPGPEHASRGPGPATGGIGTHVGTDPADRRRGPGRTAAVIVTVIALAAVGAAAVWWQPWSDRPDTPGAGPGAASSWSLPQTSEPAPPTGSPSTGVPSASGIRPPSPLRTGGHGGPGDVDPGAIDAGTFDAWDCELDAELPVGELAFRGWADALLACTGRVYRDRLPALAERPADHRVGYIAGRAASACGPVDAAAFFCPGDQTIYLDVQRVRRFGEDNRLAAASVVMHEYAHLVQQRLGVLGRGADASDRGERIRRIELQADCLTLGLLSRWRQAGWTEADRSRFVDWRFRSGDREHGSDASRVRWLLAGLEADSFAACDTWSAPSSEVA